MKHNLYYNFIEITLQLSWDKVTSYITYFKSENTYQYVKGLAININLT